MSQVVKLELKNLSMEYGSSPVLRQLSLQVRDGDRLGIMGPSGSGKSTLLKLCAGLLKPTQGEVLWENLPIENLDKAQLENWRTRMSMLFQRNALFDSLTCLENVAFPLRLRTKLRESEIKDRAADYLDKVGLAHALHLLPAEISGGMQKRLGVARALALDPELLFYDDPTAGLDPITSKKIIELILALKEQRNSTILVVTNDVHRMLQVADRAILIFSPDKFYFFEKSQDLLTHKDAEIQDFILSPLQARHQRQAQKGGIH